MLGSVMFLTLLFEQGVFYILNYKILQLDSPKTVKKIKMNSLLYKGVFHDKFEGNNGLILRT